MRKVLACGDLPAFVALVRAAMGLSQLELASLVGWSQSTVNRIEHGERGTLYDIRELVRFADAIDMPRHALLPLIMGKPVWRAPTSRAPMLIWRWIGGISPV
ncbi:hypothetical protein Sme01_19110 [Sphaerisporangium melleum]|uniref:HTH cro/C1-type domain-containing protein n=1 Tax=Sphaerisporangium melleum TaxID=321316 RepID=A0A917VNK7_9ACTN|nr:helix-turn-helix transcriptional regulator [Sphaerisporangium melleum]GGL03130.1 hypothetical protein GCM10007964_51540 [Sphaerisporangium melleum]GII69435.1 hypothetical protein Sme01_19110 [Sphaerisporangium melleum]